MSRDSISILARIKIAAAKVVCKKVFPKEKEESAGRTVAAPVAVESLTERWWCCCVSALILLSLPWLLHRSGGACFGHLGTNSFYADCVLWETAPVLARQWAETKWGAWLEEAECIPISQKRQEEKHWEKTQASSQESRHCLFLAGAAEWKLLVASVVGGSVQPGSGYSSDSVTSKWFCFCLSPPFAQTIWSIAVFLPSPSSSSLGALFFSGCCEHWRKMPVSCNSFQQTQQLCSHSTLERSPGVTLVWILALKAACISEHCNLQEGCWALGPGASEWLCVGMAAELGGCLGAGWAAGKLNVRGTE